MKRVAVVGAGISGLAATRALDRSAGQPIAVTLFEAEAAAGGHARTVDVTIDGVAGAVDVGFLVYNERTYPRLVALFAELGVETVASDMSFSVQARTGGGSALEWSGSDLAGLFAQPANALRPAFWRMLADIERFNRAGRAIADGRRAPPDGCETLGAFLDHGRYSAPFRDWYLLPMLGCIWSSPPGGMRAHPLRPLLAFCRNHGLLQVADRPQWRTVRGGSRHYVERMLSGLGPTSDVRLATPVRRVRRGPTGPLVATDAGEERFDAVVLAGHADQSLALLADADADERAVLGAVTYRPNTAVLHTDASLLPTCRPAWAAWNFDRGPASTGDDALSLHYWLDRLQPLPFGRPVIVTLNPNRAIAPAAVLGRFHFEHPVFDVASAAAQAQLQGVHGRGGVWFCGAWAGHGFHEDGLSAGLAAADGVRAALAAPPAAADRKLAA